MSSTTATRWGALGGLLVVLTSLAACGDDTDGRVVGSSVTSPEPADEGGSSKDAASECTEIPAPSEARAAERRWIASPEARQARKPVDEVLIGQFGEDGKSYGHLSRGYIGPALDNVRRQFVVVVDTSIVTKAAALERKLQQAGANNHRRDASLPVIDVRVQESCVSADELLTALDVIRSEAWHPDAEGSLGPYSLDAGASAIRVLVGGKNAQEVGEALERKLGDAVIIEP